MLLPQDARGEFGSRVGGEYRYRRLRDDGALIREHGGSIKETYGVPLEEIQQGIRHGVRKIMQADRKRLHRPVMLGAIALLFLVQLMFAAWHAPLAGMAALLVGFFAAFNILEALLPSLVSRIAPERARGTAIGVFNTTQTLGLFAGGLAGGILARDFGATGVYVLCAVATLAWLAVAAGMRPLPDLRRGAVRPVPVNAGAAEAFEHKGL